MDKVDQLLALLFSGVLSFVVAVFWYLTHRRDRDIDKLRVSIENHVEQTHQLRNAVVRIEEATRGVSTAINRLDEMFYKVEKARNDVDAAHEFLRKVTKRQEEFEGIMRERTHWINNKLMVIASKIERNHPDEEIQLGDMPGTRK